MRILISSLRFTPAFIGHMKAWYRLCEITGHEPLLFVSESYARFVGGEYDYVTDLAEAISFNPSILVAQNIGFENIKLFKACHGIGCKVLYILHEPFPGLEALLKEGRRVPRASAASALNALLCHLADKVIVCSDFARRNCEKYMPRSAKKVCSMPLLFVDGYDSSKDYAREYFSYIGTWSDPHAPEAFLDYVRKSYVSGTTIQFQIVTRTDIHKCIADPLLQEMQQKGVLLVQQGKPLTEEEMGVAYRRSIAVWNGYRRSTQSGVLPNAYMHGTPVLATRLPAFEEFVEPGRTGMYIKSANKQSIDLTLQHIISHQEECTMACREYFLDTFYYGSQVNRFKVMIKS